MAVSFFFQLSKTFCASFKFIARNSFWTYLKRFVVWPSSEYERQKRTETLDKGRMYTQMPIEMHQPASEAKLALCFEHQPACRIQREDQ